MMVFSSVVQYTMQYKFNIRNVAWQFAIQWYQQNVTILNVSYKHCWNGHKNAFQRLYICAYLFHYLHFVLYIYLFRKIYDNIEVPTCFWWRVMNRYKKLKRDVRCKNLCSRPENVNAGKFAFSWELHTLGITREELCSLSSEAAGYAPVWPEYLSRVYRCLCGSGFPYEFKLKIFLLVYEQFLFENRTKKLGHIPIIGWYI